MSPPVGGVLWLGMIGVTPGFNLGKSLRGTVSPRSIETSLERSASVIGIIGSAASFAVAIALTGFEALIQALQAYIFTLLAAVYLSGALKADH